MRKGNLFVISGPSGVGKGTVLKEALNNNPNISYSVSATTRQPRQGETDGINYHFMTDEEFNKKIESSEFLEHVETYGIQYGTLKSEVSGKLSKGLDVILEIDVKGAVKIMESKIDASFVFIAPPDEATLRERLQKRGAESPEKIEVRMSIASWELSQAGRYDYIVLNDDLNTAVESLKAIIRAESCKVKIQDFSCFPWADQNNSKTANNDIKEFK